MLESEQEKRAKMGAHIRAGGECRQLVMVDMMGLLSAVAANKILGGAVYCELGIHKHWIQPNVDSKSRPS